MKFKHPRQYTIKLLEMVDEGAIDPRKALELCLCYMGDREVADMMRTEQYLEDCYYCGGDCSSFEDHACDGYLGDLDNQYRAA